MSLANKLGIQSIDLANKRVIMRYLKSLDMFSFIQ